jgi:hypothetical protein
MKYLIVSISLASLLLNIISCKKESNSQFTALEGVWELRQKGGSLTTTYPPGNGNTIEFFGNHYEFISNGQVTKRGRFNIVRDLSAGNGTCLVIPVNQYTNRIIYDYGVNKKIFFQISADKLTFLSGCFAIDAGSFQDYVKQ